MGQEAIGKLASLALQLGGDPKEVVETLTGIRCSSCVVSEDGVASCIDAMGRALSEEYNDS